MFFANYKERKCNQMKIQEIYFCLITKEKNQLNKFSKNISKMIKNKLNFRNYIFKYVPWSTAVRLIYCANK